MFKITVFFSQKRKNALRTTGATTTGTPTSVTKGATKAETKDGKMSTASAQR